MRLLINPLQKLALSHIRLVPVLNACRIVFQRSSVRSLSTARSPSSLYTDETFHIPIGGNGFLSLSVARLASTPPNHPNNVILYLPPGPLFQQSPSLENSGGLTPQHVLASRSGSTVVTVNYRLGAAEQISPLPPSEEVEYGQSTNVIKSREGLQPKSLPFYQYPTPVHDTLAGFDWILQTLQPAQLCVFGTHIGGSLALMLALTEAKTVRSVAALEPVCDWVSLDEYCTIALPESVEEEEKNEANLQQPAADSNHHPENQPRKKTRRPKHAPSTATAPPDLVPLLDARARFFSSPERYFDAFASPILFLRSPGRDVPKKFPEYLTGPQYPVPVLKMDESEIMQEDGQMGFWDLYLQPLEEDADVSSPATTTTDDTSPGITTTTLAALEGNRKVIRRRKALSRWPPYGLDYGLDAAAWPRLGIGRLQLTLPWIRVFARDDGLQARSSSSTGGDTQQQQEMEEEMPTSKKSSRGIKPRKEEKKIPETTILARQAEEMVTVMRRACFWGREKSFGEERVQVAYRVRGAHVEEEAGEWFRGIFALGRMGKK